MIKQADTLGELVTVIREPLIEVSAIKCFIYHSLSSNTSFQVSSCISVARPSFPSLRMVLWGPFGTGKSVTLNQSVHLAYIQNMVIVQLYSGEYFKRAKEWLLEHSNDLPFFYDFEVCLIFHYFMTLKFV